MEDRGRGRGGASWGGGWRRQDWAYLGQKLLDFFTSLNSDLLLVQIKDSHDCLP